MTNIHKLQFSETSYLEPINFVQNSKATPHFSYDELEKISCLIFS